LVYPSLPAQAHTGSQQLSIMLLNALLQVMNVLLQYSLGAMVCTFTQLAVVSWNGVGIIQHDAAQQIIKHILRGAHAVHVAAGCTRAQEGNSCSSLVLTAARQRRCSLICGMLAQL
jgi:hypothetical protein